MLQRVENEVSHAFRC